MPRRRRAETPVVHCRCWPISRRANADRGRPSCCSPKISRRAASPVSGLVPSAISREPPVRRCLKHVELRGRGVSSGHANRVEYRSGPNGQPSAHPAVSLGISTPTPSPDGCRAMCETSSMVGKCRAISTARCLRASGKLSSRPSSTRKPPAQRRALVLSCGIVIPHLARYRATTACLSVTSQIANARDP